MAAQRNPADLTQRNNRARKTEIAGVEAHEKKLELALETIRAFDQKAGKQLDELRNAIAGIVVRVERLEYAVANLALSTAKHLDAIGQRFDILEGLPQNALELTELRERQQREAEVGARASGDVQRPTTRRARSHDASG